jgi:DNA-binding NtrC family response regulator
LETLKTLKAEWAEVPVIVVTNSHGDDTASRALALGAFDYLTKPVNRTRLNATVQKALEFNRQEERILHLQGELKRVYGLDSLVGRTDSMLRVLARIQEVSETGAPVLLQGEIGTGKSLVARLIHYNSRFAKGNFMEIDCGVDSDTLAESKLFGDETSASSGVNTPGPGHLETAGTLLLNDVDRMSAGIQEKLMRCLEGNSITREKEEKKVPVDLKILVTSTRSLERAVAGGHMREDLCRRLAVNPVILPPLRERRDDIALLVNHFLKKHREETGKTVTSVTSKAMDRLIRFRWPGNVRQLENVIYRALMTAETPTLDIENLEVHPTQPWRRRDWGETTDGEESDVDVSSPQVGAKTFEVMQKDAVFDALNRTRGNIARAARELGISRATLYRKMKKFDKN